MQLSQRQRTLEEWIEAHSGLIHKVVRAYAFSRHDAEDLLQEIAVQLWDSVPRFRGNAKVSTWIYRVALYAAIAWSRRERGHAERTEALITIPAEEEPKEDPRVAWLYAQIAKLDPVDRSLALLLLEGLSYREMAETLGITESNVSVKVHRLKRTLTERSEAPTEHQGLSHGL